MRARDESVRNTLLRRSVSDSNIGGSTVICGAL
jgi:hypothetical protein